MFIRQDSGYTIHDYIKKQDAMYAHIRDTRSFVYYHSISNSLCLSKTKSCIFLILLFLTAKGGDVYA